MDKPLVTNRALFEDALAGLRAQPKRMNPKWFYDHAGSALFERITELPEYYPTRTELSILRREVATLSACVPEGAALVELGSGASTKTRVLLDAIRGLRAYLIQVPHGFHFGRFSNPGCARASEQRSAATRIGKPSPFRTVGSACFVRFVSSAMAATARSSFAFTFAFSAASYLCSSIMITAARV